MKSASICRWPFKHILVALTVSLSTTVAALACGDDCPGACPSKSEETSSGAPAEQKAAAAEAPAHWTPVLMEPSVAPQLFAGSDGKYNLVYEVVLTNYDRHPVTVAEFAVVGDDGKPIKSLTAAELTSVFSLATGESGTTLPAGTVGVIWVNLSFDKAENVPAKLRHKIAASGLDQDGKAKSWSYESAHTKVNQAPPVVVSPPLHGGRWVAFGGYCGTAGHRRCLFPLQNKLVSAQRYAIDWIKIDDGSYSVKGNPNRNSSAIAYGEPVYAVADGTVCGVVDRFADQSPPTASGSERLEYPAGNSVTLDMGGGLYAMFAHLQPGSIKVKRGQKVKRGDEIGRVGNSGNSTGPHLHFHVTSDAPILASDGVPYIFDEFNVVGEVKDIEQFIKDDDKGTSHAAAISPSGHEGPHKQQLPKEGHVVQFTGR